MTNGREQLLPMKLVLLTVTTTPETASTLHFEKVIELVSSVRQYPC